MFRLKSLDLLLWFGRSSWRSVIFVDLVEHKLLIRRVEVDTVVAVVDVHGRGFFGIGLQGGSLLGEGLANTLVIIAAVELHIINLELLQIRILQR